MAPIQASVHPDDVPISAVLTTENVVDVKDIVPIFVVGALIVDRLARLGEHASGVI